MQLRQDCVSSIQQQQRLLMTAAMKQAFLVMQLPIVELAEWIEKEIEDNPALEVEWSSEQTRTSLTVHKKEMPWKQKSTGHLIEYLLAAPISFFDHLMAQARLHFSAQEDVHLAEWIIGHFDKRGFLSESLSEILKNPETTAPLEKMQQILLVIQTFDPPGIGARDTQESLLIQLKLKHKESSLAYQIIAEHFEDFLHNRLKTLSKKLGLPIEQIALTIEQEISTLNLHPADRFCSHHVETIVPDLFLFCIDDVWNIEVNHAFVPAFRLADTYQKALQQGQLNSQDQHYLRKHLTSGKWLKQIVEKRRKTLFNIGKFLLHRQARFFQGGALVPLKLSEAANAIGLHESTIARAVSNKYLACPQGTFALKDFFHHGIKSREGEVSHHLLRKKLRELIAEENKQKPYSDAAIQQELNKTGILCARRTISKYRHLLHIASASKRRRWMPHV